MKKIKLALVCIILSMCIISCAKKVENSITEEIAEEINFEEVDISDYENDKLYMQISYPVVSVKGINLSKSAIDDMNKKLKDAAEKFKKDNIDDCRSYMQEYYKENGEDAEERFYLHQVEMNVLTNSDNYLSITSRTDENLLGPHGTYIIEGWNFDKKTGNKINIFDIVKNKDDLKKYILKWCEDRKEGLTLDENYKDTIDKYFDGEQELAFYIDNEDVLITFQVYDIAPYAVGPIEIKIDKSLLK